MKPSLIIPVLIIALIICVPFGAIWSLNTLFGLTIPYTWRTLIAAMCLSVLVGNSGARKAT